MNDLKRFLSRTRKPLPTESEIKDFLDGKLPTEEEPKDLKPLLTAIRTLEDINNAPLSPREVERIVRVWERMHSGNFKKEEI